MRRAATSVLVLLALAACGPLPPQAPFQYAKKLDSATSGISTACGLAFQVTAFPGNHRLDLIALEAPAELGAGKLALVYRRNPDWIYQGEAVRQIVADAESMLSSCGLGRALRKLRQATARR